MKIITTHQNPNFDSIAGVFAALLLNPDALAVLPKKLERVQKNFLTLHFRPGDFIYDDELNCDKVSGAVLICVKNAQRIAPVSKILNNPNIFLAIFDKSPAIKCEIQANSLIESESGSITSVICRRLFEAGIEISPLYATLFALGIHEITGSLLYPNTTENDISCLAELFKRGSNLKTINFFLKEDGLSNIQKSVLDELSKSKETIIINGTPVDFYFVENHKFIYKFDNIVQRIISSQKFDIAIFIARMGNSVHVLSRSNVENVDLGAIFSRSGGGGPKYAAHVTFTGIGLEEAYEKIKTALKKYMKPALMARDIMRPSVLFLNPGIIISEAEKIMFRYAYTAAPVTDGNKVIGFIRKIDIDRAVHHGLSHAPISGFLCREIIYSPPCEPFETVTEKIARSETKTILVGNENKITGIITANDVLNHIFTGGINKKNRLKRQLTPGRTDNNTLIPAGGIQTVSTSTALSLKETYKIPLEIYFSKPVIKFLKLVSRKAAELKVSAYIVGGIVRDMILKKSSADIDIVIEGISALDFIDNLVKDPAHILNRHERFKTATIAIPGLPKIDFTTARAEFYESPAALPDIFQGNLYQDLLRRDFTIYAMAVSLCPSSFGELIDYYGGFDDITKKRIKILHNLSFIEDPTRIFRAIRFKSRLNFKIEKHTADRIKEAIKFSPTNKIEPIRIFNELSHIFNELSVYETICEIDRYSLFDFISGDIIFTDIIKKMIRSASKYLNKTARLFSQGPRPERTAIFFSILLLNLPIEKISKLLNKMNVSKKIRDIIKEINEYLLTTKTEFEKIYENKNYEQIKTDIKIYNLFKNHSPEFLLTLLSAIDNKFAYKAVIRYIFELSNIKPTLNGDTLKKMGVPPGPAFKEILDTIAALKAAGYLKNHIEEIKYAKKIIDKLPDKLD